MLDNTESGDRDVFTRCCRVWERTTEPTEPAAGDLWLFPDPDGGPGSRRVMFYDGTVWRLLDGDKVRVQSRVSDVRVVRENIPVFSSTVDREPSKQG